MLSSLEMLLLTVVGNEGCLVGMSPQAHCN